MGTYEFNAKFKLNNPELIQDLLSFGQKALEDAFIAACKKHNVAASMQIYNPRITISGFGGINEINTKIPASAFNDGGNLEISRMIQMRTNEVNLWDSAQTL